MGNALTKAGIGLLVLSGTLLLIFGSGDSWKHGRGEGDGLVFRVEVDGNVHFLAGSLHVLRRQDYPLPAPYHAAFEKSQRVRLRLGRREKAGLFGLL